MPQQQPTNGPGSGPDTQNPHTETPHCERPIHIGSTQPAAPGTPIFTGGNTGATINIDEPEQ
ncbi:MAG: hypothetical protein HGA33_05350 [Candidatus Moranbacteria bacterium]|nr:hypothetical protein [Candidatus Moranbacteria bacterium]